MKDRGTLFNYDEVINALYDIQLFVNTQLEGSRPDFDMAINSARECVELQKPKKPISDTSYYRCPSCNRRLYRVETGLTILFCPSCGQHIDLS